MTTDHFPEWKATKFSNHFHDQFELDRALLLKATEGIIAFPSLGRNSMFAQPVKKDIHLSLDENNTPTPGGKSSK